jgi:hypothetical protein
MSDYLGHLAARSLDPAGAAVRPRLASRFEPLSPWAPPLAAERIAEELAAFETLAEETAEAPTRTSRPAETPRRRTASPEAVEEPLAPPRRRRARRDPVVEEIEPAPEGRRPALASLAAAAPASIAAPAPAAMVPPQGPVADRRVPPSEASPAAEKAEQGQQGQQGRQGQEKSGTGTLLYVPVVPAVPAVPDVPVPVRPFLPNRSPGGEASKASPSEDRQTSKRETASAILQPKVTVIEREPFPGHREPPAATIQVTIGRIEVRATPAAKAPVRERPAAPSAPSLEEYLRQRSKGSRG